MAKLRRGRVQVLVAFWLGAFLLLSCQQAQPVATPKPAEKAAATPTKPAEKAAATPAKPAETPVAAATKPAEKAAATPAKPAEKPVRGGTLRFSIHGDMPTLDAQTFYMQQPFGNPYDVLIPADKDGNPSKDGLVKDWTISPDGKSITFKLLGGVKFHDGTNLDAAAVKWNIERLKDPATKSPYRSNYDAMASVEVVDPLTFRFNLNRPDPVLLPRMVTIGSMMVSPAAVQKLGQDFGRKPVGTGPFQLGEWVAGDHITLKRFDGYWGKDQAGNQLPYLDQVVFQIIPDNDVAFAALRTGQVDVYAPGTGNLPPAQLSVIKGDANLTYFGELLNVTWGISLNTKRPPFDNKALRQAVALALDREGIAARLGETAVAAASILYPTGWAYDGKAGMLPARDLAKGKAKMAEAGYPSGALKVEYATQNDPNSVLLAQIIKANLAEIGIDLEIEAQAFASWVSKVEPPGDFQSAQGYMGLSVPDPGDVLGVTWPSKGSRNHWGPYSNPKVDELLDKAGSIYDQKERTALYREAANIIADDAPYVPLYSTKNFRVMNKKVRDLPEYIMGLYRGFGRTWLAK